MLIGNWELIKTCPSLSCYGCEMQEANKRHHRLDINTLKGHGDSVTGICFSSDGRSLATGNVKQYGAFGHCVHFNCQF